MEQAEKTKRRPSIEERQAIADTLRQKAAHHSGGSLAEWWCMLQELATGEVDFPDPKDTFLALADLIEPEPERTCRMIDNGAELCCSECDQRHDYDDEPQFCMGCGAKVVRDGDWRRRPRRGDAMNNWERYFGTPEAAMLMEVRMRRDGRRFHIAVSECNPDTRCAFESRWVRDFVSWGEYLDWLNAEYDDGTIKWEEDAR